MKNSGATNNNKEELLRQLAAIKRQESEQRAAKRAQIREAAKTRARLAQQANYRPLECVFNQHSTEVKDRIWREMPGVLTAGVSRYLQLDRCVDYACGCMSAFFVNMDSDCMGLPRHPDLTNEERHIHCAEHDQTATVAAIDAQLAAQSAELVALEARKQALLRSRDQLQHQRAESLRSGAAGAVPALPSRFPWNNRQAYEELLSAHKL